MRKLIGFILLVIPGLIVLAGLSAMFGVQKTLIAFLVSSAMSASFITGVNLLLSDSGE